MSTLNNDKNTLSLLILPMTEEQGFLLQDYLYEKVVKKRGKDEDVYVVGNNDLVIPTFLFYSTFATDGFDEKEAENILNLLLEYGRQWMQENDFMALH